MISLPHFREHVGELQRQDEINVQERHEREFANWFQARVRQWPILHNFS